MASTADIACYVDPITGRRYGPGDELPTNAILEAIAVPITVGDPTDRMIADAIGPAMTALVLRAGERGQEFREDAERMAARAGWEPEQAARRLNAAMDPALFPPPPAQAVLEALMLGRRRTNGRASKPSWTASTTPTGRAATGRRWRPSSGSPATARWAT